MVSPVAIVTVTSVLVVSAEEAALANPAVTVMLWASVLSVTLPGEAVTSKAVSLAPIVNVSEVIPTPLFTDVPAILNVSANSVTASSVTNRPVRLVQALWVCPAGMDTVTGVAGAVKSTPPASADAGDKASAVTRTCKADPISLLVAVVNAARTRTATVSPSDRVF